MNDCPERGEFQRLIGGLIPADRQQHLERHLETCEACRRLLETLADVRGVVPSQPMPARDRLPESSALQRAMEQLRADPHLGADAGARPAFLQPTDCPGFLGRLGAYQIRRLVGRGGTGMVFEGFDPVLKRTVAVKVLSPFLAGNDEARSRFLREAQAVAALTNEHIVPIHAVDQAEGMPFLVLQYVSGETLADRLRRDGRLTLATVVRIGAQVARGLAAAHEQGFVHRDIKPSNLLLEAGTDRVKITDFGLAKAAGEDPLTLEGTIAGTPEFMSPEQASGAEVDARSDLFSLGAVLYTACTGISPFRGETLLVSLARVCREAPAPLGLVDPDLPDWFCQVVHRLLDKDARKRIPSARELAEALERQVAPAAPVPAANLSTVKTGVPEGPARGRARGRRLMAAVMVAAALAAAAGSYLGRADERAAETGRVPETGFMIAGRTDTFRHLAEAIKEAGDGDVIEVYGDGPFLTPPLRTEGKRLTIRAAGSAKPLFLPEAPDRPSAQPFVTADADLCLEGLDLRWVLDPPLGESEAELLARCALVSTRGRLSLTHCRIVAGKRNGCVGGSGQHLALHSCHLVSGAGACVFWRPSTGGRLIVEGCVLEGRIAVSVFAVAEAAHAKPAQLSLAQNTVAAEKTLHLYVDSRLKQPLTIAARHNIFDSAQLVLLRPLRPLRRSDMDPTDLSQFLRTFVTWSEEANLYRRGTDFVVAAGGPRSPATMSAGVENIGQWFRLWGLPANQSVEGVIKLHERARSANLQPVQLAGVENASDPVPTTVGANAGALGPGTAYHTWRTSQAYHSWLSPSDRP